MVSKAMSNIPGILLEKQTRKKSSLVIICNNVIDYLLTLGNCFLGGISICVQAFALKTIFRRRKKLELRDF